MFILLENGLFKRINGDQDLDPRDRFLKQRIILNDSSIRILNQDEFVNEAENTAKKVMFADIVICHEW